MSPALAIDPAADLYATDETAWLEATADALRRRDLSGVDFDQVAEYLTDMAIRDRREVRSRLVVLLMHLLKWDYQPEKRSRSWRRTIIHQRQELAVLAGTGVLRVHADAIMGDVYADAVERAMNETNLPRTAFPADSPYTFEQVLAGQLPADDPA